MLLLVSRRCLRPPTGETFIKMGCSRDLHDVWGPLCSMHKVPELSSLGVVPHVVGGTKEPQKSGFLVAGLCA